MTGVVVVGAGSGASDVAGTSANPSIKQLGAAYLHGEDARVLGNPFAAQFVVSVNTRCEHHVFTCCLLLRNLSA